MANDVPTVSAADVRLIETFADALWMERGLSANTLSAYRGDLAAFAAWLVQHRTPLLDARRDQLLAYLAARVQQGARPRSTARLLSTLRRFYRYLVREGRLTEDPSARIDAPKLGRALPKSLTEAEVENLLAVPKVRDPLGLRDRTMLEVLYASGLRVTELVSLTLDQVNLRQGVVRVVGKGSKAGKVVPPGLATPHWMRHAHATHALQRGAELTTVRDNLRHASLSTTSMYLHSDDFRRAKQIGGAFEAPAA